jgi:hypothetical protein
MAKVSSPPSPHVSPRTPPVLLVAGVLGLFGLGAMAAIAYFTSHGAAPAARQASPMVATPAPEPSVPSAPQVAAPPPPAAVSPPPQVAMPAPPPPVKARTAAPARREPAERVEAMRAEARVRTVRNTSSVNEGRAGRLVGRNRAVANREDG